MKKVLVGGKFNIIHPGHIYFLKKAKKLGYLIIVLAHENHNKRPYAVPSKKRLQNLKKIKIANKIVLGDKKNYFKVILKEKPDIVILGYDQKLPPGTKKYLTKMGIEILKFKKYGKYSSRNYR